MYDWQKYPGAKRQYFSIDDYKPVTIRYKGKLPAEIDDETVSKQRELSDPTELREIHRKMSTNK